MTADIWVTGKFSDIHPIVRDEVFEIADEGSRFPVVIQAESNY